MSEPLGQVVIGPREIYDAVLRLQGAVDKLVAQGVDQQTTNADVESRLRSLERGRWPLPAASLLVAVLSLAIVVIPILAGGKR